MYICYLFQNEKLRWWSIYREPEHVLVGKIQLYINYTTSLDDSIKVSHAKITKFIMLDQENIGSLTKKSSCFAVWFCS